jgi:hypothetical protein
MRSWWRTLLDAQRRAGFQDLAGTEGILQLALSDALLNSLIAAQLPATWPVSEITIHADGAREVAVRIRPRTGWLPPVQVRLAIAEEAATAAEPRLRARFTSSIGGLAGMAFGAAPLPRWVEVSGDLVTIDLQALTQHYGVEDLWSVLTGVAVDTTPGRVILKLALDVAGPATAPAVSPP